MPSLDTDIIGRVLRLPLKPSAQAALMPLFEAVSNSLHAVDDRFGTRAKDEGRIEIEVLRKKLDDTSPVIGFIITDNGVGFNDKNFNSFLKPDTQHKLSRGGKGVGRLDWLKVFEIIRVDSTYDDSKPEKPGLACRKFDFRLSSSEQVVMQVGAISSDGICTKVSISGFKGAYGTRCPIDPDAIQRRVIGHFVQILAADIAPKISLIDCSKKVDLRSRFKEMVKSTEEKIVPIPVEDDDESEVFLKIRHIRADRAIRPDKNHKNYNWMFMSAHQRAVSDTPIDDAIGLKALKDGEVYIGCVYGNYLDKLVNAERTAFTFDADESRSIRRALIGSIMTFLSDDVKTIKERKRKTAHRVVEEYPQFLYLNGEMQEFVDNLAPGASSKEQVFVEMCRDRFRRTNHFRRDEAEIKAAPAWTAEVKEQIESYKAFVNKQQQGMLAEYVLSRKSIIDILDKYIGFKDDTEKTYLEEAVHKLIVPMRTDSTHLEIKDHQLWLIDDRLAFYSYFASDKQLKSYASDSSKERPDIAFFYDTCFAWQDMEASNTVVLVEFKRPDRDDYNGSENPLRQLIGYINKIRTSTSLTDGRGRTFSPRLKNSAFHCYVVADITDTLRDSLAGFPFHDTPDGQGLIGYIRSPDAFVEIISYAKLLADAKMRNSIFFKQLGITDIDPDELAERALSAEADSPEMAASEGDLEDAGEGR